MKHLRIIGLFLVLLIGINACKEGNKKVETEFEKNEELKTQVFILKCEFEEENINFDIYYDEKLYFHYTINEKDSLFEIKECNKSLIDETNKQVLIEKFTFSGEGSQFAEFILEGEKEAEPLVSSVYLHIDDQIFMIETCDEYNWQMSDISTNVNMDWYRTNDCLYTGID